MLLGIFFMPVLISKHYTRKVVKLWASIILFMLKKTLDIKIIFQNKYIKKNQGLVIAANHQSVFDTVFFLAAFDNVIYIIKKELKYIPIYGWYASRLGNIFVNRKKKIESIKKISSNIKKLIDLNYKVIIFPEGTRQPANKIGDMKPGVYLLQRRLKKAIYPIYIDSGKTWPKNSFKMKQENISIKGLEPILYGLKKNKFKEKLKKAFEKNINKGSDFVKK
jgi:1-acyl-sn-glycerol-3-phosphate acyltransferase